jgi:hypothetical protein
MKQVVKVKTFKRIKDALEGQKEGLKYYRYYLAHPLDCTTPKKLDCAIKEWQWQIELHQTVIETLEWVLGTYNKKNSLGSSIDTVTDNVNYSKRIK